MKKRMLPAFVTVLVLISFLFGINVSAQSYKSFTRSSLPDETYENVYSRESYAVSGVIRASDFGLENSFSGISDIFCTEQGLVYILNSSESEIVVLNEDLSFKNIITLTQNGEKMNFKEAKGIYVTDESIYICDTKNARVLIADTFGNFRKSLGLPESDAIPDDFVYQPTALAIDKDGYTYVLSMGCYYGAMVYAPNGEFSGFYGSNNVQTTALDTLEYIWDLITGSDKKKSVSQKALPYAFADFCFDNDGYMITCTGATTGGYSVGQLNKLSPNGSNILYKSDINGDFYNSTSVNFVESNVIKRNNKLRVQNISSLDVDDMNYIYALDSTYGLIYIYDEQCNLISAFGGGTGLGERFGNFQKATAISVSGTKIFVADSELKSVTVFEETDFGAMLKRAQSLYIDGEYGQSKEIWNRVIALDRNNQLAYKGLAMSAYNDGDLNAALDYAQKGLDYTVYDLAYQQIFKSFVAKNFVWLFCGAIVLFAALVIGLKYKKSKRIVFIKSIKASTALAVPVHPYKMFGEIKEKKTGSLAAAMIILFLFYLSTTVKELCSGFLFNNISRSNYNTLMTFVQTAGLIALWAVINWLVCSLFSGKGTLKEVVIASAYSLLPMILFNILRTVFSHLMPLSGKALMDGIEIAVILYTLYLFSVALITVHEYTFTKALLTTAVTILGMLLVVFIIFMVFILLQQFAEFITSVFVEVLYR